MRDYAELVQSVHCCAENQCEICPRGDTPVGCIECKTKLADDTTDAIEELLAEVEHWKLEAAANETDRKYLIDENRKLVNSLMNFRVPHWISVEERLPDEWREVLTYSPIHSDEKNPHMIQLCWYIGFGKWRECQYGEIMEIPITHWMPLPSTEGLNEA